LSIHEIRTFTSNLQRALTAHIPARSGIPSVSLSLLLAAFSSAAPPHAYEIARIRRDLMRCARMRLGKDELRVNTLVGDARGTRENAGFPATREFDQALMRDSPSLSLSNDNS